MLNIILVDDHTWKNLLPLTYTRPVSGVRCGIWTIAEKWEHRYKTEVSYAARSYLQKMFPTRTEQDNLLINSSVLPDDQLTYDLNNLGSGDHIYDNGVWIASRLDMAETPKWITDIQQATRAASSDTTRVSRIQFPEDILRYNGSEIGKDLEWIRAARSTKDCDASNMVDGQDLFIDENVQMRHCYIDTSSGPVYLGNNSTILAGSLIKGPFALGDHGLVKMGAKIYGASSAGPNCKLGGEIKNSVFISHSSKSHDGYIGDSVIGQWCNFGAGSNTSNMKNTYGEISLYSPAHKKERKTGRHFLGVIMGDHSKCAINTSFNTGCVVGVFANIFGFNPKTWVPSFSWGIDGNYRIEKAIEVAERALSRKGETLAEDMKGIFTHLFDHR